MCQLRFEMQTLPENIRWSDKEDSKQSDVKTQLWSNMNWRSAPRIKMVVFYNKDPSLTIKRQHCT